MSPQVAVAPASLAFAVCPMCTTADAEMTNEAVTQGGSWKCVRCGHAWSAIRLGTAAAYTDWVIARGK